MMLLLYCKNTAYAIGSIHAASIDAPSSWATGTPWRRCLMELSALLQEAEAASPMDRIEWRDRIAAHGTRAVQAVTPWLADPALAAFAIRVIERAGANADATEAMRVLRSARATLAPIASRDLDWALGLLRLRIEPDMAEARPSTASKPDRRGRRRSSTVVPRRAR
jgi:hypothetical protein